MPSLPVTLQRLANVGDVLRYFNGNCGIQILNEEAFLQRVGGRSMALVRRRLINWSFSRMRGLVPETWRHASFGPGTDAGAMRTAGRAHVPREIMIVPRADRVFVMPRAFDFDNFEVQLARAIAASLRAPQPWRHVDPPATPYFEDKSCTSCTDCSICMSNIEVGEMTRELRCKHVFHVACATQWAQQRLSGGQRVQCATCRAEYV